MSRKDTLRALLTARDRKLPDGNLPAVSNGVDQHAVDVGKHVKSGAVGAMGRSLGKITHAVEEARALIASGDAVIELDPGLVEASFVADRFEGDATEHQSLVESIREHGQQVPILVRPHPLKPGRYQAAYGHRRLRALKEIGRPVRAVVRALADIDLIVAQGQENSARLDLSYIERAVFAVSIEDRGFERSVIMAALNVEKTQLSRLLSIGRAIPSDVVALIGSAPKTGRPRWQALADLLTSDVDLGRLAPLLTDKTFRSLESDLRFVQVFDLLSSRPAQRKDRAVWTADDGTKVFKIARDPIHTTFVFDERKAPEFSSYLIDQMAALYQEFVRRKS